LLSGRTRVIDVTAVITAEGANMISTAEETGSSVAQAAGEKPKASKKARVAPQGAHVAKNKGKPAKKAAPEKKAPKAKKPAKVREGSKTDQVLELLKRPGGVTAQELIKATGWQAHSVRGFLSGTVGKKMGLTVTSTKSEDGERNYSIKA
jgi:Protein of unknown function (DUF3489)